MVIPSSGLERMLSMGASIDIQDMLDAGIDATQMPAGLTAEAAAQELALMGLDHSPQVTYDSTMAEAGDTERDSDVESLFSPTGPRERPSTNQNAAGPNAFGLPKFHTILSASPSTRSWDSTAQDRLRKYQETLLELNGMFKSRYLDFDRCVVMATRTPHASDVAASFSCPGSPVSMGGSPSPRSPTSPTSQGPMNAQQLAAYCANLGVPVTEEKARILVMGGFARRNGNGNGNGNGSEASATDENGPCVRIAKLRKDMRVAIARSLRPAGGKTRRNGSFVRAHSAPQIAGGSMGGVRDEQHAKTDGEQPRSPRRRLRAIVARPGNPRIVSGGTAHLSPQQGSVYSPKAVKAQRYMGPSPPAIRESEEGDDEWESDQEVPAGDFDADQEVPNAVGSRSGGSPMCSPRMLARDRGSRTDRTLAWRALKRYNERHQKANRQQAVN